jgi:hypothetical protein
LLLKGKSMPTRMFKPLEKREKAKKSKLDLSLQSRAPVSPLSLSLHFLIFFSIHCILFDTHLPLIYRSCWSCGACCTRYPGPWC